MESYGMNNMGNFGSSDSMDNEFTQLKSEKLVHSKPTATIHTNPVPPEHYAMYPTPTRSEEVDDAQ
jgi:hypothetical protein